MNMAYPLIPVTILTFLVYLTTWSFVKWEVVTKQWHHKFWNILLLITFLVSGVLGIFSVIKVNYKLEIPHYDQYLQWHVSLGIAMVFISFFHLSWHLKYYFSLKKSDSSPKSKSKTDSKVLSKENYRLFLYILGFVTIVSQVIYIREFISVLAGNELIVGIVLSGWMLITGWGAFSGRKADFSDFPLNRGIGILTTLSLFSPVLIFLLYWIKNEMFPPGTLLDIETSVILVILFLFPFCFLSGYLFTAFSTLLSYSAENNQTGKAYSFESMGSLAGGLLFSILLGRLFNSFQIFGIISALVLFAGAWTNYKTKTGRLWKFIIPGVIIPALLFYFNPEKFVYKVLYPNQEMVLSKNTRYGNLVVTEQAGQLNVYENNTLQFYTQNVMVNEEAVHFAMVQHPNPKKVLLISGGISGMIKEIEKYPVEKITYLEINPEIFRSLNKITAPFPNPEIVEIVKKDIRYFIKKSNEEYDVILLNLPPPTSLGLNRFYTRDFFRLVKKRCNDQAVVITSLPGTANYAEDNALLVNSSLWKTLEKQFENRLVLTGEKNYFLASDAELNSNIAEMITAKKIENEYVNQYYFDDKLLKMRSETLMNQFTDDVPVNRDYNPYIFFKEISHWLSFYGTSYQVLVILLIIFFLILLLGTNRITVGLYTGGFTAVSLEIVLLLAYQVYFGSIFLSTALFFAFFMAGLAFGSSSRLIIILKPIQSYYSLQFALAIFAIVLPFLIKLTGFISVWRIPSQIIFFILIFIAATITGQEFLLAAELKQKKYSEISGINYATDLAGSAFGAFLTTIFLLPFFGLIYTCIIVASLNIFSGLLALAESRKSILST